MEAAIYSHPSVAEVIVIGVPDAYRGETVKAFVVLRGDATLTLEDLQKHLKDRLSPIEMPRQLGDSATASKDCGRQIVAP